jgi:c-di-GMP-binding flagellar brake protein YcgR
MLERTRSLWRRIVGRGASQQAAQQRSDGAGERRLWIRHPLSVEVVCRSARALEGPHLRAKVRNISLGGVSLVVKQPFREGDLLSVELPGSTPQSATTVLACIVHVGSEREDEWILGCNFSAELTDEELKLFGAQRIKPSNGDLRNWVRFSSDLTATYCLATNEAKSDHNAVVTDISASGVGLVVTEPIKTGTLICVELHGPNDGPATSVLACVVHVAAQGNGQWALGSNFIRELSEEDLQNLM